MSSDITHDELVAIVDAARAGAILITSGGWDAVKLPSGIWRYDNFDGTDYVTASEIVDIFGDRVVEELRPFVRA